MAAQPSDWQEVYRLACCEQDPERRSQLCDQTRSLVQQRSLELAEHPPATPSELEQETRLNEILRELWILQNGAS